MRSYALAGQYDRAIEMAPSLLGESGRNPWALGLLGWAHAKSGQRNRARACYDELEGRSRHEFVTKAWLASLAGSAGLEDDAIRWLEGAATEGDPLVIWLRRIPFWDFIRTHPRYEDILRQAGEPRAA
jgi:tetratricopeptide (TPR) repeat protein